MNAADIEAAEQPPPASRKRSRRWLRRIGATAAALAAAGVVLYAFGGMWIRTPQMRQAYDAMVERGERQPLPSRLVLPIPGCVCHSDDPVLQAEHSRRRIRECTTCH